MLINFSFFSECDQLSQANARLKTELKDATTELQHSLHNLSQSHYAEKSFAKEVEDLTKTVEAREKDIQNKINIIASLKDKLKSEGTSFNDTEKFKIDIVNDFFSSCSPSRANKTLFFFVQFRRTPKDGRIEFNKKQKSR